MTDLHLFLATKSKLTTVMKVYSIHLWPAINDFSLCDVRSIPVNSFQ